MKSSRETTILESGDFTALQMNNPDLVSQLDKFPAEKLSREAEADLSAQIKQGSESALTALVIANMREALLYTGRVCEGNLDEGERVSLCYQEMCMSARRFLPGRLRFFAFAKAGLRGRMKTYWKSLKVVRNADPAVSLDVLEQTNNRLPVPPAEEDDSEYSPREAITGEVAMPNLDGLFAKDQWQVIRKKLSGVLSDHQWMVLNLVYISGLNFPEAGKLLGVTRSAVHAAHRNAIQKLRDALKANPRLLYGEDSCS